MTWTKLGDEFPETAQHLSHIAFRTHVEALCWSNRKLLDLVVPKRDLRRFAESHERDQAAAELVKDGWWVDLGDEWWIGVHFPEWQRDKVQVEHKRRKNSEDQLRRRQHKRGKHEMCLPGGPCYLLSGPLSGGVSGPDRGGDSGPDPGKETGTSKSGAAAPNPLLAADAAAVRFGLPSTHVRGSAA